MKIRHGFVSNSSSSSFLIVLPDVPKTAKELHDWLFKKEETISDGYSDPKSSMAVAERVFEDLKTAKFLQLFDLIEMFADEGDTGIPYDWDRYEKMTPDEREQQAAYERQEAGKRAISFWARHYGEKFCAFYQLEYADDSGDSLFENGGIFENIPHRKWSHH